MAASDFDGEHSDLSLATLELLVDSAPAPRLSFRAEIELEAGGESGGSHAETEIEEAWLSYTIRPWLVPRAGVVLVPFGRYSINHFDTVQDLTSRPLVVRHVVPSSWSETAVGATGALPLALPAADVGLEYEVYAINGLTDSFSDTSLRPARGSLGGDNNDDKAWVGRLALSAPTWLDVGVSGYYGAYDERGKHAIAGFDADWDLRWRWLRLRGEYARLTIERGVTADGLAAPGHMEGLYVEPSVSFWPRALDRLKAYMSNPRLTAVARWGFAEIGDDGDPGSGANREERLTLGINLRPADALVLKLEWQHNTASREPLEHGDADGLLASVAASF